jgi:hypothetical protein
MPCELCLPATYACIHLHIQYNKYKNTQPHTHTHAQTHTNTQGDAFAFSLLKVAIGGQPDEWDYVTLESPDGERGAWEWISARDSLEFKVTICGTYRLRYFIEGGFFSTGMPVECVDVQVLSPVRAFEVDARVTPGANLLVISSLFAHVVPNLLHKHTRTHTHQRWPSR